MKWMIRLSLEAFLIFIIQIILSVVSTTLWTKGVVPHNYTACVLLAIVCLATTIVLLVISMRHKINRGYAPVDVAASYMMVFVIFAVITVFLGIINLDTYLTYLFLGYKVFAFQVLLPIISVIIVNAIIFGVCLATPILCSKQLEAERIRSYLQDDNGLDS